MECWWGDEEKVKASEANKKIIVVDVERDKDVNIIPPDSTFTEPE